MKFHVLVATPETATLTFVLPVFTPAGTNTLMLDVFQLVTGAANPLNVTVLVAPCVSPKFTPAIVTEEPTGADDGEIPVIAGVTRAVNFPTNALRALFKLDCRTPGVVGMSLESVWPAK